MLLKHKPLLVLALALAVFHLGNGAIVPLYGMAAVSGLHANGPEFVAATVMVAQGVMVIASVFGMRAAEGRSYWPILLASFLVLPLRGILACFLTGWWGVLPVEILDGAGTGLQSVAVPGMVARSLYGTGRVNLAQGAVITIQGAGAAISPAIGGWVAQWIGFSPAFLLLGGLGLVAVALWVVLGAAVKQY
jgi:MFS family permease